MLLVLLGFLIMIIALLPGAQFWFGLLTKLGTLRSTGPQPRFGPKQSRQPYRCYAACRVTVRRQTSPPGQEATASRASRRSGAERLATIRSVA